MKTVLLLIFGLFMMGSTEHNLRDPADCIMLLFITAVCMVDDIFNGIPKLADSIKKWKSR